MMSLLENVLVMLVDMDLIVQVSLDISALCFIVKKVTTAYFVFQSLIVLLMEHVQIKEVVMIQQEPVFAMKDLKE